MLIHVNSATQNIGFTFTYGGVNFTQFIASSNGYIVLGATAPSTTNYTPITSTNNSIAGVAGNGRVAATTGNVQFLTSGTAPNRICTVQYTNYDLLNTATTRRVSFQIRLYETSNIVEIIYTGATGNTSTLGRQVGLRGATTTDFNNYTGSNANWAILPAGTANNNTVSWGSSQNNTRSMPSNGRILRWTPPCTAPSTQAANITAGSITSNSASINWTNGNGAGRVVYINTTNSFTAPANGSNPLANTAWANSGQQCIFNGTGSGPVTVTGLAPGTTYWVRVYEYCSPNRNYNSNTGTNNPLSFITTGCIQPTPFITVTAPTSNIQLEISACTYAGEYNTINSAVSGRTYQFSSSIGTDWLVLTDASNNILASGTSPINWTATFNGTVRLHVSTNNLCGTQNSCRATYVNCTSCPAALCIQPTAYATVDAPSNSLPLDIGPCTFAGDYNTINLIVSGRTYQFSSSVGTDWLVLTDASNNVLASGTTPINWTATFNGTVRLHVSTNNLCGTQSSCRLTSVTCTSCPAILIVPFSGSNSITSCSDILYDHGGSAGDYANNANGFTVINPSIAGNFVSVSGSSGGENCCDWIRIYDGAGIGGTLLWQGNPGAGTVPVTTSTTGPLTVQFTSDASIVGSGFALNITCIPPCSGTPLAGTATISSSPGCPSVNFNLGSSGLTIGAGISYQWQSSPTGAAPWTNISGATNTTLTTNTATTLSYRLRTFCSNSGQENFTNVVTYTVSGGQCACGSYSSNYPSSGADSEISSVSVGVMTNNLNTCVTAAPGPGSIAGRYSNFTTSVNGPSIQQGNSVPFTVVQNSCSANNYNNIIQIYVDWNQDGIFQDTERMAESTSGFNQAPGFSGNFTVPIGAAVGTTRMRIVCIEAGSVGLNYAQSQTFTWGETEDYCFTVTAAPPCITPSAQPTALTLTPTSGTTIDGSFTASASANNYLVIRTTTSTQPTNPINGTTYTAGSAALGGTVVASGSSTTFSDAGLTPNTQYWYWVYAFNANNCIGGPLYLTTSPLNGNTTTLNLKNWIGAGTVGGTGGTNFNAAANWSPAGVPSSTDNLIISLTSAATIVLSANATVNSIDFRTTFNNSGAILDVSTFTLQTLGNYSINMFTGANSNSQIEQRIGNGGSLIIGGGASIGTGPVTSGFVDIRGSSLTSTTGTIVFRGNLTFGDGYGQLDNTSFIGDVYFDAVSSQNITIAPSFACGFKSNRVILGLTNTPTVNLFISNLVRSFLLLGNTPELRINPNCILNMNAVGLAKSPNWAVGGLINLQPGSTLRLSGSSGGQTGSNFPTNFTTYTFDPASTVEYYGGTQTVFATPTYGNLTLSTTGSKSATASLTLAGNLLINSPATFAAGTSLTHNIGGNWTNNGTFSFTTANTINFNGNNALQTISGSSATVFNNIIVNKGTNVNNILEANGVGALSNNGNITISNGLFKMTSGTWQFNAGPTIPNTGGISVNGATLNGGNFSYTNNGWINIASGTANFGTSSGNQLSNQNTGYFSISGGTANFSGRLRNTASGTANTGVPGTGVAISGGTLNICTVGNASSAEASFGMSTTSNLNISAGTIIFQNPNSSATTPLDINIISGGTKTITGGTFQIGNASTAAAQTFNVRSDISLFNFTINSTNSPTVRLLTSPLTLSGTLAMNGGNIDGAANNLDVIVTNSAAGAVTRTAGYINGNLRRAIASTGANYLFPVGLSTSANYTPAIA
jgi:hypothetical protein